MLTIARSDLGDPDVRALIAALDADLSFTYPEPGANHFRLDPDEVTPGRGILLIARDGVTAVGCGAVRLIDDHTAEIKRMFTIPSARGKGFGRAILAALEAEATRLGARRIVLETGARQAEALRLYDAFGFVEIPRFGEYVDSPLSVCLGKSI
jgi:GNAT superfamily N-acetyltransferase